MKLKTVFSVFILIFSGCAHQAVKGSHPKNHSVGSNLDAVTETPNDAPKYFLHGQETSRLNFEAFIKSLSGPKSESFQNEGLTRFVQSDAKANLYKIEMNSLGSPAINTITQLSVKPASVVTAQSELNCLGSSLPMSLDTNTPFVELQIKLSTQTELSRAWFLLDTGGNFSIVDQTVGEIEELNFFNLIRNPKLKTSDLSGFKLPLKHSGVIGTDYLAKQVFAFDYGRRQVFLSNYHSTCSATELQNAGMVPISTEGFFTSDTRVAKLHALEYINPNSKNPKKLVVANGPVIPVEIALKPAITMIDSGFDDRLYPFSVNINQALLDEVNRDEIHLIRDTTIPDGNLKTCIKDAKVHTEAYRLKSGDSFTWKATNGTDARRYANAVYFLKTVTPEARVCGGIATWEIPAAQIGASFLKDMGLSVFNAKTQKIWVPQSY